MLTNEKEQKIDITTEKNNLFKNRLKYFVSLQTVSKLLLAFFYKKQVRRSRRLRGLQPENTGFQEKLRKARRNNSKYDNEIDSETDLMETSHASKSEYDEEEYYEFFLQSWLNAFL